MKAPEGPEGRMARVVVDYLEAGVEEGGEQHGVGM